MENIIIVFILLSITNVIFSTAKSIITIKGSPFVASLVSSLYYGYYNIVLVYTVADFPLWEKVVITGICNLIGVYTVKKIEEKQRKVKLWKVEATIPAEYTKTAKHALQLADIPHNYISNIGNFTIFNIYCATQEQSKQAKIIINQFEAKYFVSENQIL